MFFLFLIVQWYAYSSFWKIMTCIPSYTHLHVITPATKYKNVFWYSEKIRFFEHQEINGHRRPVPGVPSSGTSRESQAMFRDGTMWVLFTLSLLCVFATLVKVHKLVYILKLESTSTPTGSAPKAVCQPSHSLSWCFLLLYHIKLHEIDRYWYWPFAKRIRTVESSHDRTNQKQCTRSLVLPSWSMKPEQELYAKVSYILSA